MKLWRGAESTDKKNRERTRYANETIEQEKGDSVKEGIRFNREKR